MGPDGGWPNRTRAALSCFGSRFLGFPRRRRSSRPRRPRRKRARGEWWKKVRAEDLTVQRCDGRPLLTLRHSKQVLLPKRRGRCNGGPSFLSTAITFFLSEDGKKE
ncbi:hypothetical protein HPB50_026437 [Hyalomma asiaticum]|uniref:Uncharacterized protein n=1 Tax=Hyalomma asiaticum TaxID=266040 RepID=A0ACB7SA83_HYAAI|nr:hypothetical protein HPB50_026437 [Hyalomma asiaticum]